MPHYGILIFSWGVEKGENSINVEINLKERKNLLFQCCQNEGRRIIFIENLKIHKHVELHKKVIIDDDDGKPRLCFQK